MDTEAFGQYVTDNLSPLIYPRWVFTALLLLLYIRRIIKTNSHSVLTYFMGIYLLHAGILFLTPKDDNIPDPFENTEEESYNPRNIDNDFRPYVRRLPEFDFWKFSVQMIVTGYFLTFFSILNFPVYKPILVVYFIFFICVTCYKLWVHSRKFKYHFFPTAKSTLDQ